MQAVYRVVLTEALLPKDNRVRQHIGLRVLVKEETAQGLGGQLLQAKHYTQVAVAAVENPTTAAVREAQAAVVRVLLAVQVHSQLAVLVLLTLAAVVEEVTGMIVARTPVAAKAAQESC